MLLTCLTCWKGYYISSVAKWNLKRNGGWFKFWICCNCSRIKSHAVATFYMLSHHKFISSCSKKEKDIIDNIVKDRLEFSGSICTFSAPCPGRQEGVCQKKNQTHKTNDWSATRKKIKKTWLMCVCKALSFSVYYFILINDFTYHNDVHFSLSIVTQWKWKKSLWPILGCKARERLYLTLIANTVCLDVRVYLHLLTNQLPASYDYTIFQHRSISVVLFHPQRPGHRPRECGRGMQQCFTDTQSQIQPRQTACR